VRWLLICLFLVAASVTPAWAQDAGCVPALLGMDGTDVQPVDVTCPSVTVDPPAPPDADPSIGWAPGPRVKTFDCVSIAGLPDAGCTPGATDPRVSQETIASTICVSGYTTTVRPSTSVTNRIKVQQMVAYGLQDLPLSAVELDHLIPLELGGAPADVANLWPESWTVVPNAHEKDAVENFLHRQVCTGALSLLAAQQAIATDWYAVYTTNGLR